MARHFEYRLVVALLAASPASPSGAQTPAKPAAEAPSKKDEKKAATPAAKPADAQAASPAAAPPIPDGPGLSILIRRTLLSLNDANLSGNYTVFRELAAPGFQTMNDANKLSEIFANLRKSKIDFAPIVYFIPKLVRQPQIENGRLRVSGFIPTTPQRVNFDMLFENVEGRWRVFGIAVSTTRAQAAANPAALGPPSAAAPAAKPAEKTGAGGVPNKK